MIQDTITGSKKVCTDPICCKLPICLTNLHSFIEIAISSQKYNDLLFITILSCCFYGCHHLGELILKNGKDEFHWQKIIECGSLIFGVDHISYCLPYYKTDHFYHSTTVLFPLRRLLILLLSSSHLLAIATPFMVPRLLYFSVKMDLSQIVSGLTKDSLLFLIIILVAILFML